MGSFYAHKGGTKHDPLDKEMVSSKRFWVEDGLLYTKGRRIYVPKRGNLRRYLIKECYETKWAGHPRQRRTILLKLAYYRLQMWDEAEQFVRTCLVCQ